MKDSNESKIPEAIWDAIEKAGFWCEEPSKEPTGFVVEVVGYTAQGGEMLHVVNFRNFENPEQSIPLSDIKHWKKAIREIVSCWDVEEEVHLHDGILGAPSLTDLVQDLQDYKEKKLDALLKCIESVAE